MRCQANESIVSPVRGTLKKLRFFPKGAIFFKNFAIKKQ